MCPMQWGDNLVIMDIEPLWLFWVNYPKFPRLVYEVMTKKLIEKKIVKNQGNFKFSKIGTSDNNHTN